ncbi:head GIN domain-containing protein [Hymenobacter wooponensis]|uniref:DUF2807 domain-containing protein n=1 Tax=Hymenobacter wooponensis TaxID=1525360 RepID=A0A4Z0MP18_9BACT|nr:head GIN domain-containing protein [Hymenobacter wooponensis]TGD81622.1 DUF2807 domain-containing protein [Hymenobacter wooponensis]
MKTLMLRSALAASLFTLASGAVLAQKSQTRTVGDFEMLQTSGAVNVMLRQGSQTSVRVEAEPEVLEQIKTEVKGNKLVIYRDQKDVSLLQRMKSTGKVMVYITCPRLNSVESSGACDIKSETPFKASDFTIRASGASDITLNIDVKNLNASASGASDLRVTGYAERQQVSISGSSDYRAYDLKSKRAQVQASGASDAYVAVADELSSRSSGASDIHYKGSPRVIK